MLTLEKLMVVGCREEQIRSDDLVHNGGWYNAKGEKLGWGDLSSDDFINLARKLSPKDGPLFVLGEQDSYWKFVDNINCDNTSPTGFSHDVDEKEKNPEFQYVLEHARWIVWEGCVFNVDRYQSRKDGEAYTQDALRWFFVRVDTVNKVMLEVCLD